MRWLAEMLRPSLRCERIGHDMVVTRRQFLEHPDMEKDIFWRRYVAVEVTEATNRCRRCLYSEPWREEDRRGINSLTTDSERLAALRRGERVPL